MFQPTFLEYRESHKEDDEDKEDDDLEGNYLDALLRAWDDEEIANEDDTDAITTVSNEHIVPKSFELNALKQRGAYMCGFEYLGKLPRVPLTSFDNCFGIQTMAYPQIDPELDADDIAPSVEPTQKDIVQILFTRVSRRSQSFAEILNTETDLDILEANGSARSIIDWARKLRLDPEQKRAFEIITVTFVLTFY